MSAIPGDLETDRQPPMTVPLRHFVVGIAFLLLGTVLGIADGAGVVSFGATLAHVHLLLAGWVCVTIMGAMTQFVPVWSGVELHSRRLAVVELWLVAIGLAGFAAGFVLNRYALLPLFGGAMVLGFWAFVYNVGRTLGSVEGFDVTERHFAIALGFFLLVTGLGFLLALDFTSPVFEQLPVDRSSVLLTHATLAVFGAVLTTILGALYQLSTMFTQTDLHGIDLTLKRVEEVGYPAGVLLLALGRLVGSVTIARVGGGLVVLTLIGFSVILARRLYETKVPWTPMLSRYAVVAPAMATWAILTAPAWLLDPLAPRGLFGAPGTVHLLVLGVVGFVVLGTLYHVVPFIVWVHRYSDLLGYEPVPMINDLYVDRVAKTDFALLVSGTVLVVLADLIYPSNVLTVVGGVLALTGVLLFTANMLWVLREHSPHSIGGILFDSVSSTSKEVSRASEEVGEGETRRADSEP